MDELFWKFRFARRCWQQCGRPMDRKDWGWFWASASASYPERDPDFLDDTPEDCADSEMSYWEP